jgi:hypothetical protein
MKQNALKKWLRKVPKSYIAFWVPVLIGLWAISLTAPYHECEAKRQQEAPSRPDNVTKYDPPNQATDVLYANKKLVFTTTSGSKWNLAGDGISFTGQVDPRPRRPSIAVVKVN